MYLGLLVWIRAKEHSKLCVRVLQSLNNCSSRYKLVINKHHIAAYLQNDGELLKIIDNDKERYLPIVNRYALTANQVIMDVITQKIVDFYFDGRHNKEIQSDENLKYVQVK